MSSRNETNSTEYFQNSYLGFDVLCTKALGNYVESSGVGKNVSSSILKSNNYGENITWLKLKIL